MSETEFQPTPMLKEVAMTGSVGMFDAICKVMGDIQRQEKLGKNTFDNYNFTSIDDFKDHIRPLFAKHGLSVAINENTLTTQDIKNRE